MDEVTNKMRMQGIFDELANGNGRPFVDAMADDFSWRIIGTTSWSRTYRGKDAVRKELLTPLFDQLADRYRNSAQRILSDEDYVVVECKGNVNTKNGRPYNNDYCYVIRMADGMMKELTEYCDTALIDAALGPPS